MTPPLRSAALAALVLAATTPAFAQAPDAPQPAVPSVTTETESQDSGVGDQEASGWVGQPVVSSDRKPLGTLRDVRVASDTADAGLLIVERDGGGTVEVPMQGASFDGTQVIVTPLAEALTSN
ncbi:PRC-barrel domain containing protein [Aureimonas flava]|uniref:PRC-barrel domain containing protein n=1 Tax=Aureimonas flava TaxID=2320271 RepID=A0A3A1WN04_9HYPH|nr:PRC-barrel domain-containing protein [Aureimonas flava]RIY02459.1 PRC-barrel domain containing protein [Aureimonas flava]